MALRIHSRLRHRVLKPMALLSVVNVMLLLVLPFYYAGIRSPLPGFISLPFASGFDMHGPETCYVIYITRDQKVFLETDDLHTMNHVLDSVGPRYKIQFSEKQRERFATLRFIGTDIQKLPSLLDDPHVIRKQEGIPVTEANHQLQVWISAISKLSPKARILIYADEEVPYALIRNIFDTLGEIRIFRFYLMVYADLS